MYIYIPFSEIGYVKVIYLIKRFVKHPQKENSPFMQNENCSNCKNVQILHKIFISFYCAQVPYLAKQAG